MHAHRRSARVIVVVAAVVACDRGAAAVSVQLESIAPDAIVVAVETAPELSVALCDDGCARVATDGAGRASLSVPVPTDGNLPDSLRRREVEVVAIREGWRGDEVVGTGALQLPFFPGSLRRMPPKPDGPWMAMLATNDADTRSSACFGVRQGEGSVAVLVGASSATIAGTPGATVQLGGRAFTIAPTGIHTWSPTADDIEALFPGPDVAATAVRVEAPGQGARTIELELELMDGCRRRLGDAIRDRVSDPEAAEHPGELRDIAVVVRSEGALLVLGKWREGDTWRSARYVAIEEEQSRTTGGVCSKRVELARAQEPGFVDVSHVDVTPQIITTRVTLHRLPEYDVVATKVLPPEPGPEACEERVIPSDAAVKSWIAAQVPALAK